MTSPVRIRLPFRLAGRFFSGLTFTAVPFPQTMTGLGCLAASSLTALICGGTR
ncbi:MAG: hypothetical protein LBD08_00985 [Treponema sp.]|nr:hypothetical protein [Treponema sp.]